MSTYGKKHIDIASYKKNKYLLIAVMSSYIQHPPKPVGNPQNPRTVYFLCPFRKEQTPSVRIFKARDGVWRYKCFGCGKSGDVFRFVRTIERDCCFPKAVRIIKKLQVSSHAVRSALYEPQPIVQLSFPFVDANNAAQ